MTIRLASVAPIHVSEQIHFALIIDGFWCALEMPSGEWFEGQVKLFNSLSSKSSASCAWFVITHIKKNVCFVWILSDTSLIMYFSSNRGAFCQRRQSTESEVSISSQHSDPTKNMFSQPCSAPIKERERKNIQTCIQCEKNIKTQREI